MRDEQPVPNAPKEATEPEFRIEVVEGTDPTLIYAPPSSKTVVVEAAPIVSSPDTELVERLYTPGVAEIEAVAAWPATASSPTTGRTPRQRRLRRALFSAAILGLMGITVVSLYEFLQLVASEEEAEAPPAEVDVRAERPVETPAPPVEAPVVPTAPELEDLVHGDDAASLLAIKVQWIDKEDRPVDLALRSGVKDRRITVVNLWATYCGPCKREMPALQKMFEESGWGDDVAFVPILDSDSRDPVSARDEVGPTMPKTSHFLVDQDGQVRAAARRFVKATRKKKRLDLPVTLVFDCHRRLRQVHPGELLAPDIAALKTQLGALREELGQRYCLRPLRSKPAVTETTEDRPEPRCGDGACSPPETMGNCCDCRTCDAGYQCVLECGGPGECKYPRGKTACVGSLQ